MINDHKVVVCLQASNLIEGHYYPLSKVCVESISSFDFVDEIMMMDCYSTDETISFHENIPKVFFYHNEVWKNKKNDELLVDPDPWWSNQNDFFRIRTEDALSGNKSILITCQIDDFWPEEFGKELEQTLHTMVDNKLDGFSLPWTKVYTKDYAETTGFRHQVDRAKICQFGIYRYDIDDDCVWHRFETNESGMEIHGMRSFKLLVRNFKNTALQYDNWFFTKDRFMDKVQNHCEWSDLNIMSPESAFETKMFTKAKIYGTKLVDRSYHPPRIVKMIDTHLNKNHLGWNFFGVLAPPGK